MIRHVVHDRLNIRAHTNEIPEAYFRTQLFYRCEINCVLFYVGPFWFDNPPTKYAEREMDRVAVRAFEKRERELTA